MRKYQFTGHLSPLPPGVKLPLQLSGEVYLVSEVDAKFKEYDDDNLTLSQSVSKLGNQLAEKDATIVELKQSIATLSRSNTRLRQKIDRLSS